MFVISVKKELKVKAKSKSKYRRGLQHTLCFI